MQELVRLRMRPSRDKKSFRYMLDYVDKQGRRRQVSLGHADKRKAERQRREKELLKLTDFCIGFHAATRSRCSCLITSLALEHRRR